MIKGKNNLQFNVATIVCFYPVYGSFFGCVCLFCTLFLVNLNHLFTCMPAISKKLSNEKKDESSQNKSSSRPVTKEKTLLDSPSIYKPFKYTWAYLAWQTQQRMHWLPEEVNLSYDLIDWRNNLTDSERNLCTQIFRFFTQADVEVQGCYVTKYAPVFQPVEVRMMLSAFSNIETIHIAAYAYLVDTLGMPEEIYEEFLDYKEMRDKYDYLHSFNTDSVEDIAITLGVYSAFVEGMQLFASFAILLNFQRFGKMKGMGQIITWSIRDETLHSESMCMLFRTLISENPHIWTRELREKLYQACDKAVYFEDMFIDLAFSVGDIEGLTAEEVKQYIRYIADRRLEQIMLKPKFLIKKNPLEWVDEANALELANFFENRSTEYTRAASIGTWEEAFAIHDEDGKGKK